LSAKTLSFHPPPLAWFWARAPNLASVLEVMMAAALATLPPLPPSELAALVLLASKATTDVNGGQQWSFRSEPWWENWSSWAAG